MGNNAPTIDDINKAIAIKSQQSAPTMDDIDKAIAMKTAQVPDMGEGKAALISGENGATLGLRPVIAGLGAGAGAFTGTNGSLSSKFSAAKDAFMQGRQDANDEQNLAQTQYPKTAIGANLGGSLLTLPLLPAKGFAGAVKLGAGLGAAQAAGSANSPEEAAIDMAGGAALGGAGYGVAKGVGALGGSDLVQSGLNKVKGVIAGGLSKTASELTGISDKEIESYSSRADKVNKIYQDSGGDPSLAAQHAKENIVNDVQRTRQSLNSQISTALQNSSPLPIIDSSPIIQKLEAAKSSIHPIYGDNDINAINGIIDKVKQASTDGKLNINDLQSTKNFLYDSAKGSYNQDGNIFPVGKEVAKAAKGAGASAKNLIDTYGPPEIKNANRQLQQLHEIEDHMGNNLLDPNAKSHGDIYAVGAGVQNNNSQALKQLGDMTGKDYLQGATDLSAARTFGNAPLFPAIKTGRALIGPVMGGAIGGGAGAMVGGAPGAYVGAKIGGSIGAVLSSPAALKAAINTGRFSGEMIAAASQKLGISADQVLGALKTPQGQEILIRSLSNDNNQAAASQKPTNVIKTRNQLGL